MAWLVLAVALLAGLGLAAGAIASRRQLSGGVVAVLCIMGVGIALAGALLALSIGLL